MTGTFILLAMTMVLGAWVLWPGRSRVQGDWVISAEDTPLGRLAARKEVLLGNIGDLDFEFAMGKLSEDDYRGLRESLKQQTLRIMEQMEVLLDSKHDSTTTAPAAPTATAVRCSGCGGDLPSEARFCPSCGSPVQ